LPHAVRPDAAPALLVGSTHRSMSPASSDMQMLSLTSRRPFTWIKDRVGQMLRSVP
jgi:hypothetical protein